MQATKPITATIYGAKWIDNKIPEESHWLIIMGLNIRGLSNVLVSKYDDGRVHVVNPQCPFGGLACPDDVRYFADIAIEYVGTLKKDFPLEVKKEGGDF